MPMRPRSTASRGGCIVLASRVTYGLIGLHMSFQNTPSARSGVDPGETAGPRAATSWLAGVRTIAPAPACAAAALAVMLYASSLDNPFVYDDFRLIVENPAIQNLSGVVTVLARDITRPAVSLSYVADTAIWGTGPFGYHLTNV